VAPRLIPAPLHMRVQAKPEDSQSDGRQAATDGYLIVLNGTGPNRRSGRLEPAAPDI
jgi:hypothetical protein